MQHHLQLADFDYALPNELIGQEPLLERSHSRLMRLEQDDITHLRFDDLTDVLEPGDLIVVNDTQVVKARLFAHKDSGGQAEILLERIVSADEGLCQVRVSKPLKPGRTLNVAGHNIACIAREGEFYRLRFPWNVVEFLEKFGHIPLPPYITRADGPLDESRYQTVYGVVPGAVAAPTAGLHFSEALFEQLQVRGVEMATVTLHIGAGTFQPVRGNDLGQHQMHHEWYEVPGATAAAIRRTKANGSRVVAIGTTVVRSLESAALLTPDDSNSTINISGETDLFITPGFKFQVVDMLVTNLHLPRSTLLMLVCAFAGYDRVMSAYRQAVEARYRFFSYGDAMLLEREHV